MILIQIGFWDTYIIKHAWGVFFKAFRSLALYSTMSTKSTSIIHIVHMVNMIHLLHRVIVKQSFYTQSTVLIPQNPQATIHKVHIIYLLLIMSHIFTKLIFSVNKGKL